MLPVIYAVQPRQNFHNGVEELWNRDPPAVPAGLHQLQLFLVNVGPVAVPIFQGGELLQGWLQLKSYGIMKSSVLDPYSSNPDPDPAKNLNPDPDPSYLRTLS